MLLFLIYFLILLLIIINIFRILPQLIIYFPNSQVSEKMDHPYYLSLSLIPKSQYSHPHSHQLHQMIQINLTHQSYLHLTPKFTISLYQIDPNLFLII